MLSEVESETFSDWLAYRGRLPLRFIGLVILFVTQARLVWETLTPQELAALRQAVRPEPQVEMAISGSDTVVGSWYNWLASHLFPGVLLVEAKINKRNLTLVVDTGVDVAEPLLLYAKAARVTGIRLVSEAPPVAVPEHDRQFPAYHGVADQLELGKLIMHRVPVRVVAAHHRLKSLGLTLFRVVSVLLSAGTFTNDLLNSDGTRSNGRDLLSCSREQSVSTRANRATSTSWRAYSMVKGLTKS